MFYHFDAKHMHPSVLWCIRV